VSMKVRLALLSRSAYVNVHTSKNPAGEIRGQILSGKRIPIATTQAQITTSGGGGGYGGYG
jgi:CHRD domain